MNNKLVRQNGMIAGVCAGIASAYGWDPSIVRLVFLLLLLPGGVPGPLIYFILWMVMPKR